jgi:hypothetical protein
VRHAGPQHASRSHVRLPRIGSALVITKPPAPRLRTTTGRVAVPRDRGFTAWARSSATRAVFGCESHWNPRAVNPSGKYRGLIQADSRFWRTYGGLAFASRPDLATTAEQLRVAYAGWLSRGWQPWTCARIVGVR